MVFLQVARDSQPNWVSVESDPAPLPGLEVLVDLQEKTRAVGRAVADSVVGIEAGSNRGSGVIVRPDGLILTAAHVFENPGTRVTVYLADGRAVSGVGVALSKNDAGYIQLDREPPRGGYPYVPVAEAGSLSRGDWCLAFGHPGGYRRDRSAVMRLGTVSGFRSGLVQTDAAIQSGDSGGPLFDLEGRVVGIHSRIYSDLSKNFHVPMREFIEHWPELFGFEVPFLGVELTEHPRGCEIREVIAGFGAESAGFRPGDVIESIDGVAVRAIPDVQGIIAQKSVGEVVRIGFRRSSDLNVALATLSPRPREGARR